MSKVIVPIQHPNPPEPHEIEVAHILAKHYNCTVEFLIPIDDYKRKTPDIVMLGRPWEIKSPTGDSRKYMVKYQFARASKQHARSLIFDGRRTKLPDDFLLEQVRKELAIRRRTREVIYITKSSKIIELP